MAAVNESGVTSMTVDGLECSIMVRGNGPPLLFLHPENGLNPSAPIFDYLAERWKVIAPTHPGFELAEVTERMTEVDDLAYFYLELMDAMNLHDALVVGISFGAWVAAEIAIKSTRHMSRLVLANALGIKVGDRETRDIMDIFAMTDDEYMRSAYFNPENAARDLTSLSEDELLGIARSREATARYGWSPFMHDPKLKARLRLINIPTLVLWGEADHIVTPAYGRSFCEAVPGARFEIIEKAGHFPHIEQPVEFADRISAFAGGC